MIGDYNTTETVHLPFNTFTSDDPSASVTITNLAAGDIHIHKDGSVTQRSSSAGVTISIDFDGITGNHMAHIDLSDNTDAGFYASGSTFQVRIEGTTVDAGTINAWIGTFSIDRTLRPTTAGRTLDIQATGEVDANLTMMGGTVQSATDLKDFADAGYDPATNKVQGVVLTDTLTTYTNNTPQSGDAFSRIGVNGAGLSNISLPDQTMNITGNLSGSVGSVIADVTTDAASRTASKADVSAIPTNPLLTNDARLNNLDASIAAIPTTPMRGTDGAITDLTGVATEAKQDTIITDIGNLNDITVQNIIDGITDGTFKLDEILRAIASGVAGKTTNGGKTFRSLNDDKDRSIFTVNASQERTSVTRDLT